MAEIMFRKQDYEQVVLHFERLLEHRPGAIDLYFSFVNLASKNGTHERILAAFR